MNDLAGNMFGSLIVTLAVLVVIFLVCREIFCWYWKINQRVALLNEIRDLLAKNNGILPANENHKSLDATSPRMARTTEPSGPSSKNDAGAKTPVSEASPEPVKGRAGEDLNLVKAAARILNNPRVHIDDKVKTFEAAGGKFSWGRGVFFRSYTATWEGLEHKFRNEDEFSEWLAANVLIGIVKNPSV